MTKLIAELELDRETKNTYRYAETEDSPAAGAIGTLYLMKFAAKSIAGGDKPEKLTITVEVSS